MEGALTREEYRKARERLGLTQQELAETIGRHPSIVSKRERGLKPITKEAELSIRYIELEAAECS